MATTLKPILLSTTSGSLSPVEVAYIQEHIGGKAIAKISAYASGSETRLGIIYRDGTSADWGDDPSHQMELYFPDAPTSLKDGNGRYCYTAAGANAKFGWENGFPRKICFAGNYAHAAKSDLGDFGQQMTGDGTGAEPPEWSIARSHFGYRAEGDWASGAGAGFTQTWGGYDSAGRTQNFKNFKSYYPKSGKGAVYTPLRPAGLKFESNGFSLPDAQKRRWASDAQIAKIAGRNSVPSSFEAASNVVPLSPAQLKGKIAPALRAMMDKRETVQIPLASNPIIGLKAPVMDVYIDQQNVPFVNWVGQSPRQKNSITRRDDYSAAFLSSSTGDLDFVGDGTLHISNGRDICLPLDLVHSYISSNLQSACFKADGSYVEEEYPEEGGFGDFLKTLLIIAAIALPVIGWVAGPAIAGSLLAAEGAAGVLGTGVLGTSAATLGNISLALNVGSGVAKLAGADGLSKVLGIGGSVTGLGVGVGSLSNLASQGNLVSVGGLSTSLRVAGSAASLSGNNQLASTLGFAGGITNIASGVVNIAGSGQLPTVGALANMTSDIARLGGNTDIAQIAGLAGTAYGIVDSGRLPSINTALNLTANIARLGGNTDIAQIAGLAGTAYGVTKSNTPVSLASLAAVLKGVTPFVAPKPVLKPAPIRTTATIKKPIAPPPTAKISTATVTMKRVTKPV